MKLGVYLNAQHPESDDPAHQEPIQLDRAAEGEDIRVWAKVLWVLRKP